MPQRYYAANEIYLIVLRSFAVILLLRSFAVILLLLGGLSLLFSVTPLALALRFFISAFMLWVFIQFIRLKAAEGKQFNPVQLDYDQARLPTKPFFLVRLIVTMLVGVALLVAILRWVWVEPVNFYVRIMTVAIFVGIYFIYGPNVIWTLPAERNVFRDVRVGAIVGGAIGFMGGGIIVGETHVPVVGAVYICAAVAFYGMLVGIVSAIVLRVTCKLMGV